MANFNQLISDTFNSLPSGAASGWVRPSYLPQMQGRTPASGFVSDRLPANNWVDPPNTVDPVAWNAAGGWNVDPQTGALAYTAPTATNPAVAAAATQAGYPTVADYGADPVQSVASLPQMPATAALPGMVPGATPIPRAPAGSPTSSGQGGLFDWLGGLFGGTNAGGLLKTLSPDTFYGIGEALKGKGFSDDGLKSLLAGNPAGSTATTTSWGASKTGPGGESWAAGPRPSGSSGGGDSLMSGNSHPHLRLPDVLRMGSLPSFSHSRGA